MTPPPFNNVCLGEDHPKMIRGIRGANHLFNDGNCAKVPHHNHSMDQWFFNYMGNYPFFVKIGKEGLDADSCEINRYSISKMILKIDTEVGEN